MFDAEANFSIPPPLQLKTDHLVDLARRARDALALGDNQLVERLVAAAGDLLRADPFVLSGEAWVAFKVRWARLVEPDEAKHARGTPFGDVLKAYFERLP